LPKHDTARTVVFSYQPHGPGGAQALLVILPGLFIAGIGSLRRREEENIPEPDETEDAEPDAPADEA